MAHIWKTSSYFFPLLHICMLCDEVLLSWNFRSPGFDIRAPQDPQIWKKLYFFHILGLNLKISYQMVSLFDMYKDMGERIAGKQDRPAVWSLKTPQGPLNSPKYIYYYVPERGTYSFCSCFPRGVRRPQLTLSDHLKKKLFRYLQKKKFYMSMVSIAWLVLIFRNFWKTRWPPQPFFCWLRILTTSDQLKEKLWIYLHQTFHMDIRWHKLGWCWFSTISEKQDGRHSQFLADSEYWRRPIN